MTNSLRLSTRVETVFIVSVVVAAATGVLRVLRDPLSRDASDIVGRQFWVIVYSIVTLLAFHHRSAIWTVVRQSPLVVALLALALASIAWSANPALTFQSAIALIMTTLFGWYMVARYEVAGALNLIIAALGLIVSVSVAAVFIAPSIGIDPHHDGAWRGILTHKNSLGRIAALAIGLWMARAVARRRADPSTMFVLGVAAITVLGSQSRTSFGIAILLVAGVAAVPLLRAGFELATAAAMFLIALSGVVGLWLVSHVDVALNAFGADTTLTGRTAIWDASVDFVRVQPLLGYGYDAFWGGFDSPGGDLWSRLGDAPQHAHNGLLDIALGLGVIGAGVYVVLVAQVFLSGWRWMRRDALGAVPVAAILAVALFNLSESTAIAQHSLAWILTVVVAAHSTNRLP